MENDLLPCPFCGSENVRLEKHVYAGDDGERDGVECLECDALNSVENWNKRADSLVS